MRKVIGVAFILSLATWAGSGLVWVLDHPEFRDTVTFKAGVTTLFLVAVSAVFKGGVK
jgi:hypothetical protein